MLRKNFLVIILSFSLLLLLVPSASFGSSNSDETEKLQEASVMRTYEKVINEMNNLGLADAYSGSYIDNGGKLIILLQEGQNTDKLKENLNQSEVEFASVKYSIKQLDEVQEQLDDKMIELGIKATERDEINNRIIVYLSSIDKKTINAIKNYMDLENEDIIEFKKMDAEISFDASDQ
mgnify:CR=1 FL=1